MSDTYASPKESLSALAITVLPESGGVSMTTHSFSGALVNINPRARYHHSISREVGTSGMMMSTSGWVASGS